MCVFWAKTSAFKAELETIYLLKRQRNPSAVRLEHSERCRSNCRVQPEINAELVALPESSGAPSLTSGAITRWYLPPQPAGSMRAGRAGVIVAEEEAHVEAAVCTASLSRFGLQLCTFSKCWLAPRMLSSPLEGGAAGRRGMYMVTERRETDRQTYRKTGVKGTRGGRSQVPLLAKGHRRVYETQSAAHIHTHIHACSSSPRTPSGKISLVFII